MKIPGRLWLQFEVDPDPQGGARIRQTTVFHPAGYVGLGYWYLWCPVHQLVFGRMLRGIAKAASVQRSADGGADRAVDGRRALARFTSVRRRSAERARNGRSSTRRAGS
jgi:hypothetical protein